MDRQRSVRRRASLVIVGLATALTLLASACGGSGSSEGGAPSTDATAASQTDPDGTIRVGWSLTSPTTSGPVELDPTKSTFSTNDPLQYLIWGRLMRPTASGVPQPDLAQTVTVVDPNTIEVELREGVTFQDGTQFDAAAVRAGLERTLASSGPGLTAEFRALASVDVTGPMTLTLRFPDGTAASWYDAFIDSWQTTILKPGSDYQATSSQLPIGAGPMQVVTHEPGQRMVLERNDDYWDASSVQVGRLELQNAPIAQPEVGLAALQAGQVDLVHSTPTQVAAVSGKFEPLVAVSPERLTNLQICKASGPLSDARVRKAVAKAIDREVLIEAIYGGLAAPATEMWPEGHNLFAEDLAEDLAYDPAAATELVEEYGSPIEFDLYLSPGDQVAETAQVIQQQLAEVGMTMSIVPTTGYVDQFLLPKSPGAGLVPIATPKLGQWSGSGLGNVCAYSDPAVDELVSSLRQVTEDSPEAAELWHDLTEILVEDVLSVPIAFLPDISLYDSTKLVDVARFPTGVGTMPDVFITKVRTGA